MQNKKNICKLDKEKLKDLLNCIAVQRFVNLHFNGSILNEVIIKDIISKMKMEEQNRSYIIDVNIDIIPDNDVYAVKTLIRIINDSLSNENSKYRIRKAFSINNVLCQLNDWLKRPALIIFRQFKDRKNNKEKNILISIRKFIQMTRSLVLGILIVSSHTIEEWDLAPLSCLDDRDIAYFPLSISYNKDNN